tara:strand:+ start:21 stop:623 length:603 start_codon:yes stop_codon:yes gene_type:complete
MTKSTDREALNQHKKEIQKTLSYFDLKIIRNPLKKSIMHSQLVHRDLVKNFEYLGVPMHLLTFFAMVEDLNYDNLVMFSQSAFAEEQGTTISHVAGGLRRLQNKGFVCRLWDPANLKRRIKIWMINPTIIYRGPGYDYQRAMDNFEALMDGRYEDTIFDRDKSETSSINRRIPWLQGKLDLMEKGSEEGQDQLERKRSAS